MMTAQCSEIPFRHFSPHFFVYAVTDAHGCSCGQVCNNMALAIQMASIAEAAAAGRRLGLDSKVLADVFNSSSARCWSSEAYNPVPVCAVQHLPCVIVSPPPLRCCH